MDPIVKLNERVDVVAVFKKRGDIATLCLPYKLRYKNVEITLTELGFRHPTQQGRRMIHVFDMSDGTNDYRLEFDAESLSWTLVGILYGGDR
jgi:hypothetical protein